MPGSLPYEPWHAAQDRRGQWLVVGPDGLEPTRHPEALTRLYGVHLAAAAPRLAEALEVITLRFERARPVGMPIDERRLVQLCWGALSLRLPAASAVGRAQQQGRQQEMDLGSGADADTWSA